MMTVREFLDEVRSWCYNSHWANCPASARPSRETQGRGETVTLDPVTQYYLLHRAYFGLEPAPAGACILYANACGKNETELKVVWDIPWNGGEVGLREEGPSRRKDEGEGEAEEADRESSRAYGLLGWSERVDRGGVSAKAGADWRRRWWTSCTG